MRYGNENKPTSQPTSHFYYANIEQATCSSCVHCSCLYVFSLYLSFAVLDCEYAYVSGSIVSGGLDGNPS